MTQDELEKAVQLAVDVRAKAYCPYSKFQVCGDLIYDIYIAWFFFLDSCQTRLKL